MTAFVAEMAKQGLMRLAHSSANPFALGVVGLGNIDGNRRRRRGWCVTGASAAARKSKTRPFDAWGVSSAAAAQPQQRIDQPMLG